MGGVGVLGGCDGRGNGSHCLEATRVAPSTVSHPDVVCVRTPETDRPGNRKWKCKQMYFKLILLPQMS